MSIYTIKDIYEDKDYNILTIADGEKRFKVVEWDKYAEHNKGDSIEENFRLCTTDLKKIENSTDPMFFQGKNSNSAITTICTSYIGKISERLFEVYVPYFDKNMKIFISLDDNRLKIYNRFLSELRTGDNIILTCHIVLESNNLQ